MADGKWISDLKPATPVADAARHVLSVRLEVVGDYLPLALKEADKDPEYIHQLRVGTRRAGAALNIFAPCLPDKTHKAARKQLRRIRRAAGEARDWDVFLIALNEWEKQRKERHRPGLDFLIGYAVSQRMTAQHHLEAACEEYPFAFERLLAETVAVVQRFRGQPEPRTLVDLAQPLLAGLIKELDRTAARDLDDYENLHQVRIAGKRLRYAMEVFAECFAPPFREVLYPAVEEMQEILGQANDSQVACQRLSVLRSKLRTLRPGDWKRFKPGIEGLLRSHQQRLPRERRRFRAWWKRWQEAGTEAVLVDLLKVPEPVG